MERDGVAGCQESGQILGLSFHIRYLSSSGRVRSTSNAKGAERAGVNFIRVFRRCLIRLHSVTLDSLDQLSNDRTAGIASKSHEAVSDTYTKLITRTTMAGQPSSRNMKNYRTIHTLVMKT